MSSLPSTVSASTTSPSHTSSSANMSLLQSTVSSSSSTSPPDTSSSANMFSLPSTISSVNTTLSPDTSSSSNMSSLPSTFSASTTSSSHISSSTNMSSLPSTVSSASSISPTDISSSTTMSSLTSTVHSANTLLAGTSMSLQTSTMSSANTASPPNTSSSSTSLLPSIVFSTNTNSLLNTTFTNISPLSTTVSSASTSTLSAATGVTSVTATFPTISFPLEFRIINQIFTENLNDTNSDDFKKLKKNVENELEPIYKAKFQNFKKVTVTGFKNGSIIVSSDIEFIKNETESATAATADNTVRALLSSLQSKNSIGNFTLDEDSIKSDNVTKSSLSPLNITVGFLIKSPFNTSAEVSLRNQTVTWVDGILLSLLNGTDASEPRVEFNNSDGWTQTNATFSFKTINLLNATEALRKVIESRGKVNFSIVPSTLTIQGSTMDFEKISPPLGIIGVSQISSLEDKGSDAFQKLAKYIEDSFKDIFNSKNLVEPVVNSFRKVSNLTVASVDLYFQKGAINNSMVIEGILNNVITFKNRNVTLDPLTTDPKVGVLVKFKLQGSSDIPSTDITNLLTPLVKQIYNEALQDPPNITINNSAGVVDVAVSYNLNATVNVDNMYVVNWLLNDSSFTALIRKSSLSVNGKKTTLQSFELSPRFTNLDFTDELKNRSSQRFKDLEKKISNAFTDILKTFGISQVAVLSFKNGSVISNIDVAITNTTASVTDVRNAVLSNTSALEKLGLTLDPTSIGEILALTIYSALA
ncbi:uncharacterized protein WCC33_006377 [Rhinophrynus dorsalis]